jgi:NitT/TauT family transport system substrate-binding protein
MPMLVLLAGCTTAGQTATEPSGTVNDRGNRQELTHIRLPMGFVADPQFAPVYVAAEKGYFADEGLEVEFDYSFETDGVALVGANELPLAIVSGEQVILGRAQQLPLVYVMEWFQRFPIAVVSKTEAGIEAPEDLVGKTVGIPGFFGASYVGYVGLLSASGVDPEAVKTEEIGFTQVETLLADRVDAIVGYVNNEPVQLAQQGVETDVIYVATYIDLVANGVVTNEETIAENPQLVRGFVHAFLHGVHDTLQDPDEAFEISKKYVEGMHDDRKAVLESSLPLWRSETLGLTEPASWDKTQKILLQAGQLDAPIENLEAAYDNRFVEDFTP